MCATSTWPRQPGKDFNNYDDVDDTDNDIDGDDDNDDALSSCSRFRQ